jgi:drug/metabolite transporter superfamily protein YnfA
VASRFLSGLAALVLAACGVVLLARRDGHPGFAATGVAYLLLAVAWAASLFRASPDRTPLGTWLAVLSVAVGIGTIVAVLAAG